MNPTIINPHLNISLGYCSPFQVVFVLCQMTTNDEDHLYWNIYKNRYIVLLFCHLKYVISESYNFDNDIMYLVAPHMVSATLAGWQE